MSRAEKFIKNYTKNCSNELDGIYVEGKVYYSPWLTPDQARRAVEIAREEIYEWLKKNARTYTWGGMYTEGMINDLKKAMKNE